MVEVVVIYNKRQGCPYLLLDLVFEDYFFAVAFLGAAFFAGASSFFSAVFLVAHFLGAAFFAGAAGASALGSSRASVPPTFWGKYPLP